MPKQRGMQWWSELPGAAARKSVDAVAAACGRFEHWGARSAGGGCPAAFIKYDMFINGYDKMHRLSNAATGGADTTLSGDLNSGWGGGWTITRYLPEISNHGLCSMHS